jgi:hypothetical protein
MSTKKNDQQSRSEGGRPANQPGNNNDQRAANRQPEPNKKRPTDPANPQAKSERNDGKNSVKSVQRGKEDSRPNLK